jgi:signal transduction histidine kinase
MPSEVSMSGSGHDREPTVEELRRELDEARRREAATTEILQIIRSSPTKVEPVFDAILQRAVTLCDALFGVIYGFDGELIRVMAHHNFTDDALELLRSMYPSPPGTTTVSSRAILERTVIQAEDASEESRLTPAATAVIARRLNFRGIISVPMLRDGAPIGTITLGKRERGHFTDKQVALLQTFADQAVIAIENTRLFEAEQASKRELRESLEYQTAISEVLSVLSRSPSTIQPVFEAIVQIAERLCKAEYALIFRRADDGRYHLAANRNATPTFVQWLKEHPIRPGDGSAVGVVLLEKTTVHMPDRLADTRFTDFERQRQLQVRTSLGVPLMRGEEVIGVVFLARSKVDPFSEKEIELVTTFGDQAVIAIESARLFEEVQARNRDLTALSEVGRAVSSTLDLQVVLRTVVERAVDLSGTDGGSIFYFRDEAGIFQLGETIGLGEDVIASFRKLDITARDTGLGEAIAKRQPLPIPDLLKRRSNPLRDAAIAAGFRASLVVPLLGAEGPLGALVLQRRQPGEFPLAVVSLMQSFADQSAIALENARLFNEIAQKSQELEIASQHKSQFVANMSHELRTPLAAILGYAELMQEGFYEAQGPKSLDALTRIRANGKHLLGLINTVLDIAKIESGQFTLNMAEYAIESVVETVRSATESLAQNKKLALKTEVAKSLPIGLGDEQRLTQVLLNLVGNAIKFTDTGEVRVTAKAVNGHFNVSVADTGPGIPEQERTRIFEQFHQVDSSLTRAAGGTGLGLSIAKQIVEMHGGRIWVESIVGRGSTFRMELPVRAQASGAAA